LTVAVRRRDGPVDVMLPPLTDAGDAIAGDGTVLDGGPMDGEPQPATVDTFAATEAQFGPVSMAALLVVAASDVEVTGLRFDRVVAPHVVVAGQPGDATRGVLVHDNVLTGIDRSVPVLRVQHRDPLARKIALTPRRAPATG
jgi:hypothetical protein